MRAPRITANAMTDLPESERYCTHCNRPLGGQFAYLEMDQRINRYHDFGGVPDGKSQGWFPFGWTCAQKLNDEASVILKEKAA